MPNETNEIPGERTGGEFAAWRRLLREPDALPGHGLSDKEKDMAWDKLFERLNAKPRRRIAGYRIAAACILICLIPAARLFQRPAPEKGRVAADKVRAAAVRQSLPAPVATKPRASAAQSIAPVLPVARLAQEKRPATVRDPAIIRSSPRRPAPRPIAPAELSGAPSPVGLAEGTPPAPAPELRLHPAPKKEWKVVDINELDPGHTRPRMVAERESKPLCLKINLTTQNR